MSIPADTMDMMTNDAMGLVDNMAATRDATQTIGAAMEPANPGSFTPGVTQSWWQQLIAQIQQLFMHLQMMLQGIESRVDMNLSHLENRLNMLPNLTPAQRQSIMDRLDMTQARVDMRFDKARTMLQTQQNAAIDALTKQGMMPRGTALDIQRTKRRRLLPPGIARQVQMGRGLPPGLAKKFRASRLGAP